MLIKIIKQLPVDKFDLLKSDLLASKSEKLFFLLTQYRIDEFSDDEIMKEMKMNATSFYTLRSRLLDKIQSFLFFDHDFEVADLLKNVHGIHYIIYSYPKETASALLQHLESELKRLDMQEYLIGVYNGLKKLHLNSEKYYFYEQCYNKTVAFTLSQDKAEDLLSLFSKSLSNYLLSRVITLKEIMLLYLKEIHNLTFLYESARLNLYHRIAFLNYTIFVDPDFSEYYPDKTTEQLLQECKDLISKFQKKDFHLHLDLCLDFLEFQHYQRLRLNKNNSEVYSKLYGNLDIMFNLGPITCSEKFFTSMLERSLAEKTSVESIKTTLLKIGVDEGREEALQINYYLTLAGIYYELENFVECNQSLQKLINFTFIKNYPFAETEIKLFYTLILLLTEKYDLAENMLRSLTRKVNADDMTEIMNQFLSLLKLILSAPSPSKQKKIFDSFRIYKLMSQAENNFMTFIQLKEKHILQLGSI